jgi:antitoxin VapB
MWAGGTLIMERGSAFKKNKTQADRLPKSVPLPEGVAAVDIVLPCRSSVITPAGETWTQWFEGEAASLDFMRDREQPAGHERASP